MLFFLLKLIIVGQWHSPSSVCGRVSIAHLPLRLFLLSLFFSMFGIFPVLDEFSWPGVSLKVDFCDP